MHEMVDEMQTRAELYATIGLNDYEALDASIVRPSFRKACLSV
jgi:methylisocitrate lyase